MKLFKRILALALVVFSLLTLASCDKLEGLFNSGDDSAADEENSENVTIVANWTADVAYMNFAADLFADNAALADEVKNIDLDSYTVKTTLAFKEDGTYTYSFDKDSMDKAINDFAEDLLTGVYNVTFSGAEADVTVEEFIASSKSSITDLFSPESVLTVNGKYEYSEGKLYVTSTLTDEIPTQAYVTVELSASALEFKEAVGENTLLPNELLPITYNKVK